MTDDRRARARVAAALIVVGGLAAAIGFLPAEAQRLAWLARFGPTLVLVALAVLVLAVARHAWRRRGAFADRTTLGIAAFCAAITLGSSLLLPPLMRIQEDEALLGATALGITRDLGANAPQAGWIDPDGTREVIFTTVDQHRLAFPVLVSLLHGALGYRFEHGFWLNVLLGWGTLACFAFAGRRLFADAGAGLAWALLVAFSPIYVTSQASAGLEISHLFFLAASLLAADIAARSERPEPAIALAMLGPLLAQTRTEAVIPALVFFALAAHGVWRRPTHAGAAAIALVPLLYLPVAWHLAKPYQVQAHLLNETDNFALRFLLRNASAFIEFLIKRTAVGPLAPVPIAIAAIGATMLLLGVVRALRLHGWRAIAHLRDRLARNSAVSAFVAGAGLGALVVFAYVWGDVYIAISSRMMLVALVLLGLAVVATLAALRRALAPRVPLELLACLLFAAPSWLGAREDVLTPLQAVAPADNLVMEWIRAEHGDCRLLIGTNSSTFFFLNGLSAMTTPQIFERWDEVRARYADGRLDAVLAVQLDRADVGPQSPTAPIMEGYLARVLLVEEPGPAAPLRVLLINSAQAPLAPRAGRCALSAAIPVP